MEQTYVHTASMYIFFITNSISLLALSVLAAEPNFTCRDRSSQLRLDGGLCFEIPPWQHQPVELERHLVRLRKLYGDSTQRRQGEPHDTAERSRAQHGVVNSEVSRYMDTVIAPFLDTYHKNIQSAYQQLSSKMLRRTKDELRGALQLKQQIHNELTALADKLNISALCSEERRRIRTLASGHVARIYACVESARASVNKMGNYAEEMISITRQHMHRTLQRAASRYDTVNHTDDVSSCIKTLSRSAVMLGYELDLSLTNARRHNEQSCERLTTCAARARHNSEQATDQLSEEIHQCVYA